MFDNVIVGIDGQDGGRDALALARALGGTRITLATAYPGDRWAGRGHAPPWDAGLYDHALRMLEATRAEAGVEAEIIALADRSPARGLQELAADRGADLIALGSAHHARFARVLLGDVGRGVLHGAPCAVAVAPKRFRLRPRDPWTVGVGVDASPESRAALAVAAAWAAEHEAALEVVVVWDLPTEAVPALAYSYAIEDVAESMRRDAEGVLGGALDGLPATTHGRLLRGRTPAQLAQASGDVDLMVVGSRGWGPLRRIASGSTSDWLVHHAACPVVVVPRPEDADGAGAPERETALHAAPGG
jgi:nucleotide-binding universal stress UspA family protein